MTGFSLNELVPTWAVASEILKGDTPGHEFHGNQYAKIAAEHADDHLQIAGQHLVEGNRLERTAESLQRSGASREDVNSARTKAAAHDALANLHLEAAKAWDGVVKTGDVDAANRAQALSTKAFSAPSPYKVQKGDAPGHPFRGNQYNPGAISALAADLQERSGDKFIRPLEARSLRDDHLAVAGMHRDAAEAIQHVLDKPYDNRVNRDAAKAAVRDHQDAAESHETAASLWREAESSPKIVGQDSKQERGDAAKATQSAARATEAALSSPIAQAV